ncbi:MAG: chloride channel protein [Verrucomicrobia bacterium]|nr:chloride channel protein [Verrucomicrobiota bacterium]MDA1085861.1 chloride channel protein [Verrucomicrobiota bacterium]
MKLPSYLKPSAGNYALLHLVLLSALIGLLSGLGAILFYTLLDAARHGMLVGLAGYSPPGPGGEPPLYHTVFNDAPSRRWVLLVLPMFGGFVGGMLVYFFAPEAEGHGTDAAIEAYHHNEGRVRARVPFIKAVASALTIGSGGSGGREGPIAQIGAGVGSMVAARLGLGARERRILMVAGMASGIGAIFHAPMAGALFAAEVLYRELDLEYEVIIPSIIASILAYAVFATRFGWEPLFVTPDFSFNHPIQLIPYLVLALAVAAGAWLYIASFYGVRRIFRRLPIPRYLAPALGGLIVGMIGFFIPQALGTGYGTVQKALVVGSDLQHGLEQQFGVSFHIGVKMLFLVFIAKIATTSFSIGSGGSGGVFGPAMVIGGALGGMIGLIMEQVFPGMNIQPGAFVIVGMAGFFAAAANTPISTVIMVSEMTGNYHLLVPSMWVCMIAYLLLQRSSLYEKQIKSRFDAPVHRGDMMEAVLKNISVREAESEAKRKEMISVPTHALLQDLLLHFADSEQSCLPVVDDENRVVGLIRGRELRSMIKQQGGLASVIIAEDMASPPVVVTEEESLMAAVRRMQESQLDELAVVDNIEDRHLKGVLSHSDIVAEYHRQLAAQIS